MNEQHRSRTRRPRRPRRGTAEEIFGKPEDPTPEQLAEIERIADKLGDRAPSLRDQPPHTKNEAQAIIDMYGRYA